MGVKLRSSHQMCTKNILQRRGYAAPRSTKGFLNVDTVLDSRYLEMDVVREREGSLNGSEVGGGAKKV
jgi:hypothetical protein